MNVLDASYLGLVSLAGALARAIERGLPSAWTLRLEARPPEDLSTDWIWLHAVSVGELLLAEGLLGRMREAGYRIHVTTGTPAGLELLERRLPGWDRGTGLVSGGAFPLDDPQGLRPFLHPAPAAFVALETELWPNLLRVLEQLGVPRIIVNGRLTARSLGLCAPWMGQAAKRISLVCARDALSMEAFRSLGAPAVILGGNLKADLPPPQALHEGWDRLRQAWSHDVVLVAGNTVEGEETLILDLWRTMRSKQPSLRLILAPRQPRRFQDVANLFRGQGLRFKRASETWPTRVEPWKETDVLLLDTLGELPSAYREGTVALVGGGWTWHGGHNPMESVRWGLPTLLGPGYDNFQDLVEPLLKAGLVQVAASDNLADVLSAAITEIPLRPGQERSAPALPEVLQGTLERTWSALMTCLPEAR